MIEIDDYSEEGEDSIYQITDLYVDQLKDLCDLIDFYGHDLQSLSELKQRLVDFLRDR